MPRLAPSLLARARAAGRHLATLLPACRDLASARRELRWIREHVAAARLPPPPSPLAPDTPLRKLLEEAHTARLCARRGRGEPLQYVLGTQPFGPLELRCRRGVLVPRPETEAWTVSLADLLRDLSRTRRGGLDVLDVCTGTGCVALLLDRLLRRAVPRLAVTGLDVAPEAVALARENARAHGSAVRFEAADIFGEAWRRFVRPRGDGDGDGDGTVRVLAANPPYVSAQGFGRDTGRSVRNYEPRLALVPTPTAVAAVAAAAGKDAVACAPEDVFYRRLLDVAASLRFDVVALEVGDMAQARRVAAMALQLRGRHAGETAAAVRRLEIWRDWPDMRPEEDEETGVEVLGRDVPVRGSGHGRVVLCFLGDEPAAP